MPVGESLSAGLGAEANFESARVELSEEVGIGLDDLKEKWLLPRGTDLATKLSRSARGGDMLSIETEVVEQRRASSRWRHRTRRGDELIATQETQPPRRRSRAEPSDSRRRLRAPFAPT